MMQRIMELCAISSPRVSDMKIDSRHLLPMEVLVGFQTMVWAIVGGIIPTGIGLYDLLAQGGMAGDWVMFLMPVGIAQMSLALFVLMHGRNWNKHYIFISVSLRTFAAGLGVIVWSASSAALLTLIGEHAFPFVLYALTCIAANVASFYYNWQTRTVLDERIPTSSLQARISRSRESTHFTDVADRGGSG